MDRLNARLAALLQERARLALRIARAKARHGMRAADPARERAMLAGVLSAAPRGFPRRDLERLVRTVFRASRALVVRDERARRRAARRSR